MNDVSIPQIGFKALAIAVIIQAIIDLKSDDIARSLDAALWLTSSDMPLWLEAVGLPDVDALAFVTTGRARKLPHRKLTNER